MKLLEVLATIPKVGEKYIFTVHFMMNKEYAADTDTWYSSMPCPRGAVMEVVSIGSDGVTVKYEGHHGQKSQGTAPLTDFKKSAVNLKDKGAVMKALLSEIKNGSDYTAQLMFKAVKSVADWPELDAIEKSLKAGK